MPVSLTSIQAKLRPITVEWEGETITFQCRAAVITPAFLEESGAIQRDLEKAAERLEKIEAATDYADDAAKDAAVATAFAEVERLKDALYEQTTRVVASWDIMESDAPDAEALPVNADTVKLVPSEIMDEVFKKFGESRKKNLKWVRNLERALMGVKNANLDEDAYLLIASQELGVPFCEIHDQPAEHIELAYSYWCARRNVEAEIRAKSPSF